MKQRNALSWFSVLAVLAFFGPAIHASTITGTTILTYTATNGIDNNVSVAISGTNLVFADSAETITCSIAGALGSGTNSVSVPTAGVTSIILTLADGTDTIDTAGVVLTTQALTITQTGVGLTTKGPLTTTTGAISVATSNKLAINGNIDAGSATIALKANQDFAGTDALTQNATAATSLIKTTNTSAAAITIQVNTSAGGTASASLRNISCAAGTLTVQAFGGSILYAGTDTLTSSQAALSNLGGTSGTTAIQGPSSGGGAPAGTLIAKAYTFSNLAAGSGSIGTAARPIITAAAVTNAAVSLVGGSGGVYFNDFGSPITLTGASATGSGNVVVVAGNAGGHNLTITGNVSAVSGNIVLMADDNFVQNSTTAVVGGTGFSGNVYMAGNRDNGNSEVLTFNGSIVTSSTSANAVIVEGFHTFTSGDTDGGMVQINNITVGDGGTITVSTVPASSANGQGSIVPSTGSSVLNAGPNGTVKFIATTMPSATAAFAGAVGSPGLPMRVTAGKVVVTTNTGTGAGTTYPSSAYISNSIAGTFTATVSGSVPGTIDFSTAAGALTILGATANSTSGDINLTGAGGVIVNAALGNNNTGNIKLTAGSGGVVINAPLVSAGNITIDAGAEAATLNTTLSPGSTQTVSVTALNGLTVSAAGVLAGTAAPGNTTPVTVQAGGTISPAGTGTAGTLAIGSLAIPALGNLRLDLNSNTVFDSLNVTGAVDITGSTLALFVNGPLTTGTAFTLVSNAGAGPVAGQFAGGATLVAVNNVRYTFALDYAGGDGNDIVATVTADPNSVLDVTNGTVLFQSIQGVDNSLAVNQSGGNYTFSDPGAAISLTANAVAAGWSGNGTHTVTGPAAGLVGLTINLADGTDTVAGIDAGAAAVTIGGSGSLNVSGVVSSTASITINGFTDLSTVGAGSSGSMLQSPALNVSTSNSIGTSAQTVTTQAGTIVASAGAGGIFLTEADGARVTATATGAGNINIVNTAGTLTIAGLTSTVTGNISLSSAGGITLGANVNAGSGTITIAANADGTGAEGFDQQAAVLTTSNTSAAAISIAVNTAGGGTGNAIIGQGATGAGGTVAVSCNGGSILWSNDPGYTAFTASQTGLANGGSNAQILKSQNFVFTATGAGSIGAGVRPLQISALAANATLAASAGSSGIFVVDWTAPIVVSQALATGGDIRVVTANATGNNLTVGGTINTTAGGNIYLASDDNIVVGPAVTIGGTVSGNVFDGKVYMSANRDRGTAGQLFTMDAASAIVTTNTTNNAVAVTALRTTADQAVYLDISGDAGTPSVITLGSIATGDGGRIVVNAVPYANLASGAEADAGKMVMAAPANFLDAGATGTVELIGRISAATAADAIGTSAAPILVKAGTIITHSNYGNVFVTDSVAAGIPSVTLIKNTGGATGQTGAASVNFTTTAGTLTLSNPLDNVTGGTISLRGADGVALNATLGSSVTGAISIGGALSGTSNIVTGTGDLTVTQDADSTYGGVISGPRGLAKAGLGTLTLTAPNTYTGATSVNQGALNVNGTLASSGTTVATGGALSGTGSTTSLAIGGQLSAATFGTNGTLNTGDVTFTTGGILAADLTSSAAGPGTGYDQLNVIGTVDLTNSTLRLIVPSTGVNIGDSFILIANDGTDTVTGQFAGGTTVQSYNNPLYFFTINYAGGDGNDVVATLTQIATTGLLDVTNGVVSYSAGLGVDNTLSVDIVDTNYVIADLANPIILTANATAAGWTVNGPGMAVGPAAGITSLVFNVSDGNDAFTLLNAANANIAITGTGTLSFNGAVTTAGTLTASPFGTISGTGAIMASSISFAGANNTPIAFGALNVLLGNVAITDNSSVIFNGLFAAPGSNVTVTGAASVVTGANGAIAASTLTLGAGIIGTSGQPINTAAAIVIANGGAGGVFITEADGADITATATGAGNIAVVNTTGALNIAGATTVVNGTLSVSSGGALNVNAPVSAVGGALTLNSSGAITIAATVSTNAGPLSVTGAQGLAVNAAVTTTSGNILLNNTAGALSASAALTTTSGNISLSCGDGINLGANLNAGSGTIVIAANTDGSGTDGFVQAPGALLSTSNITANAASITVNTPAGGTGDAVIAVGTVGSTAGGTYTVQSNGGNILWGLPSVPGVTGASNTANSIRARFYVLKSSGAGSIGTVNLPIQTANFTPTDGIAGANLSNAVLDSGTGGIFLQDWDGGDFTVREAIAQGGDIFLASANETGHDLIITGPIFTKNGNIFTSSDDDTYMMSASTDPANPYPGGTIGGTLVEGANTFAFAGTVSMRIDRDGGNEQRLLMQPGTSIRTTNASSTAVVIVVTDTDNTVTDAVLGGIDLSDIQVGDGGTIYLDTGASASANNGGNIVQASPSTRLDAGHNGTVFMTTKNRLNGTAPAALAGIGTPSQPIVVNAGKIMVSTVNSPVYVASAAQCLFSGTIAGPGALSVTATTGTLTVAAQTLPAATLTIPAIWTDFPGAFTVGPVTINGAATDGDPITLTATGAAGGVLVTGVLGDSNTGSISIDAGTNSALLTTTFSPIDNQAITINANSGLTVGAGGVLAGTGSTTNTYPVLVQTGGILSPGPGILTTGNVAISGGTLAVSLNGPAAGSGYSQLNLLGTLSLTGANLMGSLGGGYTPQINEALTLVANDGTDAVNGIFAGAPEGGFVQISGQFFKLSYTGGTGNDVVITRNDPGVYYVDDDFAGFTGGQPIADADPVQTGSQAATFGTGAFDTINAGIAANGMVIVNAGNYPEAVLLNSGFGLNFQEGASTVGSLASTVGAATINLNGITLTAGADNSSTTVVSPIGGTGNLVKAGGGTLTLTASNNFTGTTTINGGAVKIAAGGALAISPATIANSAKLIVDGRVQDVLVTASASALTASTGTQLRGTGFANSITFNDSANVNSMLWPGTAPSVASLTTNESLTPLTVSSVDFSNGGKFAVVLTDNAGSPRWQKLVVANSCVIPTAGAAFSFAADTATFSVSSASTYLVISNPGQTITTTFPTVLAPPGATLGVNFDILYVDTISSSSALQSVMGGGQPLTNGIASFNANQVFVIFTGNGTGVTPVKIADFNAEQKGAGVQLAWNAVSEFQNAGFNLYRRLDQESETTDPWMRINPALIAGRITNPDAKAYACCDWAPAGEWQYKLECVSISGEKETVACTGAPVRADLNSLESIDDESLSAVIEGLAISSGMENAKAVGEAFAAIEKHAVGNGREAPSHIQLLSSVRTDALNDSGSISKAQLRPDESSAAPIAAASAGARWFTAAQSSTASAFKGVKIESDTSGVLFIPQASLPAGFNVKHVAIQREGLNVTALAVLPEGLLLYAPGYSDEYTDKDAFFLRHVAGSTAAGEFQSASGLFTSALPVNATPATASVEYHDVYFDFLLRPYNFPPWFSAKYLTSGTTQSFTLVTPHATAGAATLTIDLWSLTESGLDGPDHALQAVINGQPIGTTLQWNGGNRALQLTLNVPAGVLIDGSNQIDLVTPILDGIDSQIAFVQSLTMAYTRSLDGSGPLEFVNTSGAPQLVEVSNVPGAQPWVVDARYPDRPALAPVEAQADGNGAYRVRFVANTGGSGKYLVVPAGQENAPVSVSPRQVKPLRLNGTYLATGPSQFAENVQPLLALRTKQGIRSQYVDQEQLFDYYNYGRYGPGGIQNAVRATRPQYLLLLGRTTYDYHNYSGANVDPLCPAFLVSTSFWAQTTSDSKFGDLGRGYPEVAVGRLPVNDTRELSIAVSHILNDKGLPASGIRAHAVADAADPMAADFGQQVAALAQRHPEMAWQMNALGTTHATVEEVNAEMTVAANGGADLILYNGHGNTVRLGNTNSRILDTDSVQDWKGSVVFLQSSCASAWIANNVTGWRSIAMQALTQPQGGISAGIGTSTYMNADIGVAFHDQLLKNLAGSSAKWGKALMQTQQWALKQGTGFHTDLGNTEQLFGDPAMPIFQALPRAGGGTTPGTGNTSTAPIQTGTF